MGEIKSYTIKILDEEGLEAIVEGEKIKDKKIAVDALSELCHAFDLCGIKNGAVCVYNYDDVEE